MGTVGVLQMLPDLLFGLPAGAMADRWDRRRMMVLADLARAVLIALIPLSIVLHLPTMAVILIVTLPIHAARVLFLAAFTASVPTLVGRDQIGPANSFIEALYSLGFVLGPAIAGVLTAAIGPGPTLAIDAVSFAVSAGTLVFVRRSLQARTTPAERHILSDIREGIGYVARHPLLRVAIPFWTGVGLATAFLIAALAYYVTVDRALGADALGFVLSAFGLGSVLGAVTASRVSRGPLGLFLLGGNAITGVLIVSLAAFSTLPPMLAVSFMAGVSNSNVLIAYLTLRTASSPDQLLGRVGATARTISLGLQPVGMLAGGALLDLSDGATTLIAMGTGAVALSLMFSLSRELRLARLGKAPEPAG